MAHCNTIFSQLLKLVPRLEFEILAKQHHSGCSFRTASRWSQLVTMTMAQLIGYRDPETGKHYIFLTNNFKLAAKTIADIYKARWQVELFFKWIKQNLKIKTFIGRSKNSVLTQIWIAMCVYLLIALLKFQSKLKKSMQQLLRLLQLIYRRMRCD